MNPCGNDLNELEAHIVRQEHRASRLWDIAIGLTLCACLILFGLFLYLRLRS